MNPALNLIDLPAELIAIVLSYLPGTSFSALCLTHPYFNEVLKDDSLWRRCVHRNDPKVSYFDSLQLAYDDETEVYNEELYPGTFDATQKPLTNSCGPYQSYHELYVKIWRKYAWMIGTWAGDQEWTGSLIEIFYNHKSGYVENRRIQAIARYGSPMMFSLDSNVYWREFDTILMAEPQGSFQLGLTSSQFVHRPTVSRPGRDRTCGFDTARATLWPTGHLPAAVDRIVTDEVALTNCDDANVIKVNAADQFSDNLLSISTFIPDGLNQDWPPFINARADLNTIDHYFRVSKGHSAPPGFEQYSGLFVGDYSTHGLELIYLHYPTPNSLHAVKITGDRNIPRGEVTWAIDDLATPVRICHEREWPGARAFGARGQASPDGYSNPMWIESEAIFYESRTGKLPHTVQCRMTATEMDQFLLENESGHETTLSVEKTSVALWWKDRSYMSLFHRVAGLLTTQ